MVKAGASRKKHQSSWKNKDMSVENCSGPVMVLGVSKSSSRLVMWRFPVVIRQANQGIIVKAVALCIG